MSNKKLIKNSFYSVLQTIIMSVSTLIVYKLVIHHVGLKQTGIWSYLSSILTITGLGSAGFAGSMVFYVPKYFIGSDFKSLRNLINTSLIFTSLFTGILCAIAYFVFHYLIPVTVDKQFLESAYTMLSIIVVSFFFSGINSTFLSVLDGIGMMHLRSKIIIVGSFVYVLFCFFFVNKYGILVMPIADACKNIVIIILSLAAVRRNIPSYFPSLLYDKKSLKLIFKYGFNFQIISITQIVSDPFVKSMINKYSGSATTAIFDICLKILGAFRQLIIAANQSITPQISVYNAKNQLEKIRLLFIANFQIGSVASIILLLGPLMFSDILAYLFINTMDANFNFILCNLSIALLINTISSPAHFVYLGTGNLKWTILNNVITAVLMFILTPVLGILFGGKYVILGWSFATIVGSAFLIYIFAKENKLSAWKDIGSDNIVIAFAMIVAAAVNFYVNSKLGLLKLSFMHTILLNGLIAFLIVIIPLSRSAKLREYIKRVRTK